MASIGGKVVTGTTQDHEIRRSGGAVTDHTVRTPEALAALLGPVGEASIRKEVPTLHPVYRRWIEAAPFAVIATSGPDGLDASPRGDPAPLARVVDDRTLLLPQRRGNNRADSLRNLLSDPRIALLFLVPGIGESLRVNGRATISVDPARLASFAMAGAAPTCVIVVQVESVFFQCGRAMLRSRLWEPPPARPDVPTAGEMLAAVTDAAIDGEAYDRALPARQRSTLY